jgi:hypothetical protein
LVVNKKWLGGFDVQVHRPWYKAKIIPPPEGFSLDLFYGVYYGFLE